MDEYTEAEAISLSIKNRDKEYIDSNGRIWINGSLSGFDQTYETPEEEDNTANQSGQTTVSENETKGVSNVASATNMENGETEDETAISGKTKKRITEYDKIFNDIYSDIRKGSVLSAAVEAGGLASNVYNMFVNEDKNYSPMIPQTSNTVSRVEAPQMKESAQRENEKALATLTTQMREAGKEEYLPGLMAGFLDANTKIESQQANLDMQARNQTAAMTNQKQAQRDQTVNSFIMNNKQFDENFKRYKQQLQGAGLNYVYGQGKNLVNVLTNKDYLTNQSRIQEQMLKSDEYDKMLSLVNTIVDIANGGSYSSSSTTSTNTKS